MAQHLEAGHLYFVRIEASLRVRWVLPHQFPARFLRRKPRYDHLHGDFIGWQAIFCQVNSVGGKGLAFGIPEGDFTAELLCD
jgi:hypothetical protein